MGNLKTWVVVMVGASLPLAAAVVIGLSLNRQAAAAPADPVVLKARQDFAQLFRRAKEQAAPGCEAVGGRLWVGVDQKSGSVTVSCEIR